MASYLSLAVHDATRLLENAVVAAVLSAEALCATDAAFDPRISEVRAHPGQRRVAAALLSLLEGSGRVKRGRREKVQDAYSIRCTPQVLGPVLETLEFVRGIVEREINSVTDNPLIFDTAISGGNFHGEYLALAADYLAIAVSEVASISERRIYRLLTSHLSGLPPFLTREPGLNSGYMIAQYTAASLVAENKVLAHPASVDSLPTSAGQEDHVSMGGVAARKVRRVVENAETVVAIEMLLAAQGIDLSEGSLGKGTEGAYREIRKTVPMLERDREVHVDIEKILRLVREGAVVRASGLTGL
jgi:histidine ammonia-lyase